MAALIFGAGKTGRGLCGHLCQRAGWPCAYVDKDQHLVDQLNAQSTSLFILNEAKTTLQLSTPSYYVQHPDLAQLACSSDYWFTAVFGENLHDLSKTLLPLIEKRLLTDSGAESSAGDLYIFTCENQTHAARLLKQFCTEQISTQASVLLEYLETRVHFIECMVLKTCVYGANKNEILAQDFFGLPCDAAAFAGHQAESADIQALPHFEHQLQRKIFTYNSINAVITYKGLERGYTMLSEAANDPEINVLAEQAASICNQALIREFGFDAKEQEEWSRGALNKFKNPHIPDPLDRNGAAVKRKLGKQDRLIGPALLALKYHLDPTVFLDAAVAAMHYREQTSTLYEEYQGDVAGCLRNLAELEMNNPIIQQVLAIQKNRVSSHV